MSRPFAALLAAPLAAACASSPGGGTSASGVYTRAGWHLMVSCAGEGGAHQVSYVYPANTEGQTYAIEDEDGALTVRYGGIVIGEGRREGDELEIDLVRLDDAPESAVEWRLRARVETSLVFHAKTIVGRLEPGVAPEEGDGCSFGSRNVVWWSEEPDPARFVRAALGEPSPEALLGEYDLFAWWVRLGSVSPDPQKGVDRATIAGDLVSLAVSFDPSIEPAGDGTVVVRDGVTIPGRGVANARGLWFEQGDFTAVNVTVAQAVIADDDGPEGEEPAIQRLLVGFVDGSLHVSPGTYPPGVTGPSGWLKIDRPGLAFWEDVDYGVAAEPARASFSRAPGAPVTVLPAGRQRFVEGVLR